MAGYAILAVKLSPVFRINGFWAHLTLRSQMCPFFLKKIVDFKKNRTFAFRIFEAIIRYNVVF